MTNENNKDNPPQDDPQEGNQANEAPKTYNPQEGNQAGYAAPQTPGQTPSQGQPPQQPQPPQGNWNEAPQQGQSAQDLTWGEPQTPDYSAMHNQQNQAPQQGQPQTPGQPPQQPQPPQGSWGQSPVPPQGGNQGFGGPMPPPMPPQGRTNHGPRMQAAPGDRLKAWLLDFVLTFATCFIGYLIWFLIIGQNGYTPGKKLLGLQTIDTETGQPLGLGKMILRNILSNIITNACIVLGFWLFWDDESNQLWDKVMKTTVVYDN
jgi:uncharacterized RDD family membrane protein YckC